MKAKDLIKILEKNPEMEVKLYNGFVDDWMDISVSEDTLVKEKPSTTLMLINYDRERNNLPKLEKLSNTSYKKRQWEFPNQFADYERDKKDYSFKKIFCINGKRRGLSTFDRLGDIDY